MRDLRIMQVTMACAWPMELLSWPETWISAIIFLFLYQLLKSRNKPLFDWPLVGMLPLLLINIHRLHDWMTKVLNKNNGSGIFTGPWFSHMEMAITCDPADTEYILKTNFSNFPKGADYEEIFDFLGGGIFNADGDRWMHQRKMGSIHFHSKGFRRFIAETSVEMVGGKLIPILDNFAEQARIVDLHDIMLRFMFDIGCISIFGIDPGSLSVDLPENPFAKAFDDAEEALVSRYIVPHNWWKLQRWLMLGTEKKMAEGKKTMDRFATKYISIRREEIAKSKRCGEENKEHVSDLLTYYMKSESLEDGSDILKSDKFLRDTAINFIVAGRDSTGVALSWFFWLVSKHPEVETKILEELKKILSKDGYAVLEKKKRRKPRLFDSDELSGLVYLHATICETLRLYPSVPLVQKGVLNADTLPSGVHVRPGMKVFYSVYAMGRMEWIWGQDCLEFKPERWITKEGKLKFEPPHKFLAFNAGPRICLGKDMAFTQMKAVAAGVLYNFNIEVLENHLVYPKTALILFMKKGLLVKIKERSH